MNSFIVCMDNFMARVFPFEQLQSTMSENTSNDHITQRHTLETIRLVPLQTRQHCLRCLLAVPQQLQHASPHRPRRRDPLVLLNHLAQHLIRCQQLLRTRVFPRQ